MPGGNSTARPYNRNERKAVRTRNDASSLVQDILSKHSSGELSEGGAQRLLDNLFKPSGKVVDAETTRDKRREKEKTREARAKAGMAKGGKVSERGGKEKYKSKSAMKRHEAKESPAMEKKEEKMKSGGRVTRKMGGGTMKMRGTGAATKGTKFYRNG